MFKYLKVGDTARRCLAGVVVEDWKVIEATPDLITIGMGWTFDPATGAEIDEDLGWGPKYGITGSFLVLPKGMEHG